MVNRWVAAGSLAMAVMLGAGMVYGQSVDYALVIGEWSKVGQCARTRFELTSSGRYLWREWSGSAWELKYDGIYSPVTTENLRQVGLSVPGALLVADGPATEGVLVEVHKLDRRVFHGKWVTQDEGPLTFTFQNPKDAWFKFIKCPSRRAR